MYPGASLSSFEVGARVKVVQGVYSGTEGKVVAVNPSLNRLQVQYPTPDTRHSNH